MLGHSSLTRLGNSSLTSSPYRWFFWKGSNKRRSFLCSARSRCQIKFGFFGRLTRFFSWPQTCALALGWSSPCLGKFLTSTPYRWALTTIFRTQGITVNSSTGAPRFTVTGSLILRNPGHHIYDNKGDQSGPQNYLSEMLKDWCWRAERKTLDKWGLFGRISLYL